MASQKDPTRDAIKALLTAGKRADVMELLAKESDKADHAHRAIAQDDNLSDVGRKRALASDYLSRRGRVEKEIQRMAAGCIQQDRSDAAGVLGLDGLKGDPASLSISMRDASDRVAEINSATELADLLRRADRIGDEVLARAIASRALDLKEPDPLHLFLETRPHLDAAVERLWNAGRADTEAFDVVLSLQGLRPSELMGMSADAIEAAAGAEEAKPEAVAPTASAYSGVYQSNGWD